MGCADWDLWCSKRAIAWHAYLIECGAHFRYAYCHIYTFQCMVSWCIVTPLSCSDVSIFENVPCPTQIKHVSGCLIVTCGLYGICLFLIYIYIQTIFHFRFLLQIIQLTCPLTANSALTLSLPKESEVTEWYVQVYTYFSVHSAKFKSFNSHANIAISDIVPVIYQTAS